MIGWLERAWDARMIFSGDSENPRLARILRVSATTSMAVLLAGLASVYLAPLDLYLFRLFMPSVAELFGNKLLDLHVASASSFISPWNALAAVVVSYASVWIGYRLHALGRLVTVVQLFLLCLFYSYFVWTYAGTNVLLFSLLALILLSSLFGVALKSIDRYLGAVRARSLELSLRNNELKESRLMLVQQDEMERRLLAADLHDQVLNDLKSVNRRLQSGEAIDSGSGTVEAINDVMLQIRLIMDNLCPHVLEHFGLVAAVEECLEKASVRSGFDFRVRNKLEEGVLESFSQVETQLIYRLIQESITNIVKHAGASVVKLELSLDHDQVVFRVIDNGKGFPPGDIPENSRGLGYMRLRAALIGAKVAWLRNDDTGTTVEIRVAKR